MGAHVFLEIEVSELIGLLQLQKGLELLIRVDLATISDILEIVRSDILVDLAGHICASHFGSSGLLQKLGKLIRDLSGLHKSGRSTVSNTLLLLGIRLLGSLKETSILLLESSELGLEGSSHGAKLVKLVHELD